MSLLRKLGISLLLVGGACGVATSTASAGQPVKRACLGDTFKVGAAIQPGGGLGALVSFFAQVPDGSPGLGNGIQALQAGVVTDGTLTNSCN
jgi:hypothetical protein